MAQGYECAGKICPTVAHRGQYSQISEIHVIRSKSNGVSANYWGGGLNQTLFSPSQ